MSELLKVFVDHTVGYAHYLGREVTAPGFGSYFWGLIALSALAYALEILRPWREGQARIRRDFWLDGFYMFWNFFGFPLVVFVGASAVVQQLWARFIDTPTLVDLAGVDVVWQWLLMFLLRDFLHWNVHRMLHRVPWMWEWHKVHHSVREMGFAAHLRYHWMETVIYRVAEALPLAVIGFTTRDFFVVHMLSLAIGHLNHANFRMPMGPLGYLFNSAAMHIWHHASVLPVDRPYGMNYGISLSLWDYLFGTAYVPRSGRDIELGFPELESFPISFTRQLSLTPHRRQR